MLSAVEVRPPLVPRWAYRTAHIVPFTVLPSGLWRVALGLGVPVGFSGRMAEEFAAPGWITAYVIALTLTSESLAFLTVGLVSAWGDQPPRWVPFVGGKSMRPHLVALAAASGGLAVTALTWFSVIAFAVQHPAVDPGAPHGLARVTMMACYAPLFLWGPLLLLVTANYWWRRCQG